MAGFDSLYTGITGLNAYQSWIDLISNNIANVDTVGFKGQSMTFADLFYQNQTFPSAPTNTSGGVDGQQLGYGVKVNSVDTNWGEGGLQNTGVATNMAIQGDGFFVLNNLEGSATPTYTRDGNFSLNQNGVLYDPASGLAVQGWEASNGTITGGATGNITIPIGLKMQAVATGSGTKVGPSTSDNVFDVALGGNLDQTQWQQNFLQTINAQSTGGQPYTVSTTFYDSLGNAHSADIIYVPDTVGAKGAFETNSGGTSVNNALITVPAATNVGGLCTVTSAGGGKYTVDFNGVNQTVNAGSVASLSNGVSFTLKSGAAGTQDVIKITAAQSGLPSVVQTAAGVSETPATRWQVEVKFTDGTQLQVINKAGSEANGVTTAATFTTASSGVIGYAYFAQDGNFINSSSIETATGSQGITTDTHAAGTNPSLADGNELEIALWGTSAGNAAAAPSAIGFSYGGSQTGGGMTSLAGQAESTAGAGAVYTATVLSQNGYAAGTLNNITIGTDGTVTGAFSNGQQEALARVAIARFQNESGLQRVGGNQYEASANSGLAQVGVAGTGSLGYIQSGALEGSNVSLATEFTNLIIAQRAFEANTRGITTADQNMQTVINLRASEN